MKILKSFLRSKILLLLIVIAASSFMYKNFENPTLYIIGDSTVKNGNGNPNNIQQGWGSWIDAYFDTNRINIQNHAIGGRSTRTFITDGRWDVILKTLKKGDYVIMQFGHNDSSPLDDTARARGTLKGVGNDSTEIYNPIRKMKEVVHSYGWYLKKFATEAKAKGATVLICSPIPRNNWKNHKVQRSDDSYGGWAKEISKQTDSYFIDLNNLIADQYDDLGEEKVKPFFPQDNTHTNIDGAMINAKIVIAAIQQYSGCGLNKYMNVRSEN
jgi:lysophospholipase L1-like esterase